MVWDIAPFAVAVVSRKHAFLQFYGITMPFFRKGTVHSDVFTV